MSDQPFDLKGRDLQDQAGKWGIHFDDTTSHESLLALVVKRAAHEHVRQYQAAVNAVWHDRINALKRHADELEADAKPADEEAKPEDEEAKSADEEAKLDDEEAAATSTGSATTAEQPKEAAATKPIELGNPALSAVILKPRCDKCQTLLDGQLICREPDCTMFGRQWSTWAQVGGVNTHEHSGIQEFRNARYILTCVTCDQKHFYEGTRARKHHRALRGSLGAPRDQKAQSTRWSDQVVRSTSTRGTKGQGGFVGFFVGSKGPEDPQRHVE